MAEPTLYEWFAASVARVPDAVAVEVDGDAVTYRELDELSARLATRIVADRGRVPRRVALLASRSRTAFAGYLAVTRLGAVVVPLNAAHPVSRNRDICHAACPDLLLADAGGAEQAAELTDLVPAMTEPSIMDTEAASPAAPPEMPPDPDAVAYILFTSGSTGQPKGVPVRHRNVAAFIAHNVARYDVGPGARMSHTFDLTFDLAVFDLFVTWAGGATLICPDRTELLDPVHHVAVRGLTHWFSVPSVVTVADELGTLGPGIPNDLRYSIFCGEQLTFTQARAWRAVAPSAVIVNAYGPTELTIACADYALPAAESDWPATTNGTVPIGQPYPHLDAVVLDADGRPAHEGELCVRGPQRFDGYLDPADDTGRFTPTGHYRTGDVVRAEDGQWVHVGRLDQQVQVNGYRVELGEVEAALRRADGVGSAVVIATGDRRVELAGFYTGDAPVAAVRRALRRALPLYMVPRRLVQLPSIPLNANGKFDRPRLRELAATPAKKTLTTAP